MSYRHFETPLDSKELLNGVEDKIVSQEIKLIENEALAAVLTEQ